MPLEKRKNLIVLIIEDNGKGFATNDQKTKSNGIGLTGMSERAKILGGELEIESEKKRRLNRLCAISACICPPNGINLIKFSDNRKFSFRMLY